jgi:hypothetical protein
MNGVTVRPTQHVEVACAVLNNTTFGLKKLEFVEGSFTRVRGQARTKERSVKMEIRH